MRYFGGMNAEETAEVVGCSVVFCLENLLQGHGQRRLFVVPKLTRRDWAENATLAIYDPRTPLAVSAVGTRPRHLATDQEIQKWTLAVWRSSGLRSTTIIGQPSIPLWSPFPPPRCSPIIPPVTPKGTKKKESRAFNGYFRPQHGTSTVADCAS